eukprot:CAMPEP_0172419198 /NCGR_PEP_ID=MMETSP1064-20121228/5629_1 /TAXON_ID=202472 /ORGANISM="Aulacoseira subarctica , Strain CCAP 1002/5" /LENGTH=157 /DNA_ID=CAMNT_0013158539 /DNA_START=24 /DNA_END=497 /DNA_ORIENTATION=-
MAAVACTFASINVCNYIKLEGVDGFYSRSIWRGQLTYADTCASYKGSYIYQDKHWMRARYYSIISQIAAGGALLSTIKGMKANKGSTSIGATAAFAACLFQGLTLLFLTSSACDVYVEGGQGPATSCSMDQGAKLAIASTVLWGVSGVLMAISARLL